MGFMMEKKVLIVDDEERVVQSIAGVLEDEGFRVTTARSGEEAIEYLSAGRAGCDPPRYLDARDGWHRGIETTQMDVPRIAR